MVVNYTLGQYFLLLLHRSSNYTPNADRLPLAFGRPGISDLKLSILFLELLYISMARKGNEWRAKLSQSEAVIE